MEEVNKQITVQKEKLANTRELVTASLLVSTGEYAEFNASSGPQTFIVKPFPETQGAWVFMLLKSVPLFQTIQLQYSYTLQPKWTYRQEGNVLIFRWADPIENLRQHRLQVGYVPDPRFHMAPYHSLSLRDGRVWADDVRMPEFPSAHPLAAP
jgi:hypothetical protein